MGQELDRVVASYWFEIADVITTIEQFSENPDFKDYKLAARLASKVPTLPYAHQLISNSDIS